VGVYHGNELKFVGKVGTGFNVALLKTLHARFEKIRRETCPFHNLPEKRNARYGQTITAAEMKRCRWVDPSMVCQVRFSEWTRDEKLRQPVFLGIREDKNAPEVVREKAR
jgi:bifunctional non-homologous end joining protein LigD